MFLMSKDEKILVLLYRIDKVRMKTLLGQYRSGEIGQNKIRRLKAKIERLGGDSDAKIHID